MHRMDPMLVYPMWPMAGSWIALAILGCVALTVLLVVVAMRIEKPWQDLPDRPKQVLDERLARGDIDLEEYRKLRALIG